MAIERPTPPGFASSAAARASTFSVSVACALSADCRKRQSSRARGRFFMRGRGYAGGESPFPLGAREGTLLRLMKPIFRSLLPLALLLPACGTDKTGTPPAPTAKPAAQPAPAPAPTFDMDADIKTLMAKAEQPDAQIEIQHILISFKGAPRMRNVTRSLEDAGVLAKQVYAEVMGGGDFGALVKQYTNDSFPGIYPLTKAGRAGMVQGFGDVGFRLKVGEVGVAPYDKKTSPYGWHIIKRLK